jgi:NTE family protein
VSLFYTFRLLKDKVLGNDLYGGFFSAKAGNVWDDKTDMKADDLRKAGSIFIVADSVIGPVYLSYGHCEGGFDSVYFYNRFLLLTDSVYKSR